MATESEILVKLTIQGQSPDEIRRLASQTQGQLNTEIKSYLDQLTQLHRKAAEAQTDEDKKASKNKIDATEKQLDLVNTVMRANETAAKRIQAAHEQAAHKAETAWRSNLEVMFHVVEITKSVAEMAEAVVEKMEQLADSISQTTAVYGSLKGSIDAMREATAGEVSDFDLIKAKNQALQKDLHLTDEQFGIAAGSANAYASAVGTNTTEALNQLLEGLANGNPKILKQAGIMVDAEHAYDAYAKKIGIASAQLSDHGKKIALVQESLRAMDEKVAKAGASIEHFGNKYEQIATKLKNIWNDVLMGIGQIIVKAVEGFTIDLPDAIRLSIAKIKDMIPGSDGKNVERVVAQHDANLAAFYGQEENAKKASEAKDRLENPENYAYSNGDKSLSIDKSKLAEAARKAEAEALRRQKSADSLDAMFRKGSGIGAQSLGDEASVHQFASPAGLSAALGAPNTFAMMETMRKAQMAKAEADEKDQQRQAEDAADALLKINKDALDEAQAQVDDLISKAGGGLLATAIFGKEDDLNKFIEHAQTIKQTAAECFGMVAQSANQMTDALGASLAAMVSGDKASKSLKQQTHDILEALATQAYSKAIFQTAEGLAYSAMALAGNPAAGAAATAAFSSAAMFAAVGTAAALGARAVGNPGAKSAAHGAGTASGTGSNTSGGMSSSGGGFGSGGQRSSGGGSDQQSVNIYVNAPLGDRAEIGRGINLALAEYFSQSGRGVNVAAGSV